MCRRYRYCALVKFLKWSGTAFCLLGIVGTCRKLLKRAAYLPEGSWILTGFSTYGVLVVVVLPILCVGITTVLLWLIDYRLSRSIPPLHCQDCGYNLTGNTSGICPECGTPIPDEMKENLTSDPAKE